MKRINLIAIMMIVIIHVLSASPANGETPTTVRLRMTSAFPTKLPVLNMILHFVEQVELASNGTIEFKIYEPGQLIPPFEIQEAVSKGRVEAGYSGAVYLSGQIPATLLFTTIPFGPNITEYLGWFYYGNGMKLYQEMYDKYGFNVKVWPLVCLPTEAGGWFRKPINSVNDFKGLRLRWPGLGAKVLSKLGASVSTIPTAEIFPSMEKGAIDGTEFGTPLIDSAAGLWKVAKYNYFPGWHQSCTALELTMNKDTWNTMSKSQQALIEVAVMDTNLRSIIMIEAGTGKILKENEEKHGVKNMLYSPEILKALQKVWLEVLAEESAKDEFFKTVWEDLRAFMKDYNIWASHSYPALPPRIFE